TGLTALNLELKGISGFTNSIGNERFVFYDFLCTQFTGELSTSAEGEPKWWNLKDIDKIPMQDEIRKRLPLYLRKGNFESINYWDDNKKCISENKTILFD
ncbi:8-oxo-dGTP diphosphatase, partial [Streptococcus pneumoniae]|nr:8-oxo-dGTP diphosphatase [Streptococcus pneumoniae]